MSKQVIAVDIDEVLFPFTSLFLAKHNAIHGDSIEQSDLNTYYFLDELYEFADDENPEDMIEGFLHEAYKGNMGPYNGAVEAIQKLKQNFTLEIITARRPSMQAITEKWLNKHFPEVFKGIHFPRKRSEWVSKAEICKEIGALYLIDDHPTNLEGLQEAGVTFVLFGNYPWNKMEKLPKGVVRVNNWQEVERYFDKELGK